jgi:hypothetical protein
MTKQNENSNLTKNKKIKYPHLKPSSGANLTVHALNRMAERGIPMKAVNKTIAFGRIMRGRGATIYAIGKKEISILLDKGIDLKRFEGVHVVMSKIGSVLTVYRNLNLPKLKPKHRMPDRIFRQNQRARDFEFESYGTI